MTVQGNPDLDYEHLLRELPCDQESLDLIEHKTQGQADNCLWHKMRRGLMTASNMKRVCTRHTTLSLKPETDCSKLVQHIIGDSSQDIQSAALVWGRKKERKARQQYSTVEKKRHKNFGLAEKGLLISKEKPIIACSVDGFVTCSCDGHKDKLVEIKCPFALRTKSPKDAARQRGCQQNPTTGEWSVSEQSEYYYQIQTQLFVYNLEQCDLVIYTMHGILVIPVKYNEQFAKEIVGKAEDFYRSQVVKMLLYGNVDPE